MAWMPGCRGGGLDGLGAWMGARAEALMAWLPGYRGGNAARPGIQPSGPSGQVGGWADLHGGVGGGLVVW